MRGNGKASKEAQSQGRLSAFVKPAPGVAGAKQVPDWVDWSHFEPELIWSAVVACNAEGGSLLFGHTRDKSSYSVVVFFAGEKQSYYFPCSADGAQGLREFLYALGAVHEDSPAAQ